MSQELKLFDQLKADVTALVAPVSALTVTDVESAAEAIKVAKTIKAYSSKVEDKRVELVKPLNDQVKLINTYAKDVALPLLDAERHLKSQLAAFESEQEKIRAKALREEAERQRKAEAEAAAALEAETDAAEAFGDGEAEAQAIREQAEADAKVRAAENAKRAAEIENGRIKNTKKVWKCEAIDLEKVPRAFLKIELNEAAVLAAARGGMTEIAGVRLWQETVVTLGTHTGVAFNRQIKA